VLHLKFWWDRGFLDWAVNPLVRMSAGERLLMPITIFGHYLALLVAPIHLSPDYSANAIGLQFNPADPYFAIGAIATIAWFAAALFAIVRRNGALLFCLIAFGVTYGVISNLVSLIGTIFGERLIYLPSAFFLIIVALTLAKLSWKALAPLAACLLVLASVRTFTYARLWNDKVELFETTLAHHPDSIRLYLLLANEYRDHNRFADAKAVLDRGTQRLPGYWEIWLQAGITALRANDLDEAQRCILEAMKLQPGPATSYWLTQIEERRAATTKPTTAPVK
jgi:tetratricopeptide (TPR) repeat protein